MPHLWSRGRPPREFTPDFASNVSADFDSRLEDLEDYFAITGVTVAADKKRLVLKVSRYETSQKILQTDQVQVLWVTSFICLVSINNKKNRGFQANYL